MLSFGLYIHFQNFWLPSPGGPATRIAAEMDRYQAVQCRIISRVLSTWLWQVWCNVLYHHNVKSLEFLKACRGRVFILATKPGFRFPDFSCRWAGHELRQQNSSVMQTFSLPDFDHGCI